MNAYDKLREIGSKPELNEQGFTKLIIEFKNSFLAKRNFKENLAIHRKPSEYLEESLQQSYHDLQIIGQREEMKDIETKNGSTSHGYVYSKIRLIWEVDKRLNLYRAIKAYCQQTGKDFNTIAVHMAEYRGLEKVGVIIRANQRKNSQSKKPTQAYVKSGFEDRTTINLFEVRDYLIKTFQSEHEVNLFTLKNKFGGPTRAFEFLNLTLQTRNSTFRSKDILSDSYTIRRPLKEQGNAILTAAAIVAVSHVKHKNYSDLFASLTHTELKPSNVLDLSIDPFYEIDYEFLLQTEGFEANPETKDQRIILLNETERIKELILSVYNNHMNLLQVEPRQFEEVIAELLRAQGFKVELTKQTRDGGYDIIALYEMADHATQKWLVECKRLTSNKVGIEIIRSFKEVVQSSHANRGIIATTSYFSLDAIKKQQETPYLLDFRDKDDVMQWIANYANQRNFFRR
jgi:HJR/Mrr/RecB family endonuclease